MQGNNQAWNLQHFVDSLVVELDKARENLALKGINNPLTYSVKDLNMELQVFPEFDGNNVTFTTAKVGQSGASKISLQLGSITDRQIRETTKKPPSADDISIDTIDDIDEQTKKQLRTIGVNSVKDMEKIQERNVDLKKVAPKVSSDYKNLANLIEKARRKESPPVVNKVSVAKTNSGKPLLVIQGQNLATAKQFSPLAFVNGTPYQVLAASSDQIFVAFDLESVKGSHQADMRIILDPYAFINFTLK
jgi:hypothetical protein